MAGSKLARKISEAVRHRKTEHASLALQSIVKSSDPQRPPKVLDLGPACPSNIKFYSEHSRQFHFEDLTAAVIEHQKTAGANGAGVLSEAFKLRSDQRFDHILCWDLLSYLSRDEVQELGEVLAKHSHAGTKVYLLLPVRAKIPGTPLQFKLGDEQRLVYEQSSGSEIAGPCYRKTDLKKLWPQFERKKSILLKNGFEEHLYSFQAAQ